MEGIGEHEGRPFLAMELVHGVPLNEWAARHNPPMRRRIELLIAVCQAVHHVHTRGVVHRDLKPSNIMLGMYGDYLILFADANVNLTELRDFNVRFDFLSVDNTPSTSLKQAPAASVQLIRDGETAIRLP